MLVSLVVISSRYILKAIRTYEAIIRDQLLGILLGAPIYGRKRLGHTSGQQTVDVILLLSQLFMRGQYSRGGLRSSGLASSDRSALGRGGPRTSWLNTCKCMKFLTDEGFLRERKHLLYTFKFKF